MSTELNRALQEMKVKERFKEILFFVDTCDGETFYEHVEIEGIYFVTSSIRDQKASSYSYDFNIMAPTADRMHYKLFTVLQQSFTTKNFKKSIHEMFMEIKKEKEFMISDVNVRDTTNRKIVFEDFFGNYLKKESKNKEIPFNLSKTVLSDTLALKSTENLTNKLNSDYDLNKINQEINKDILNFNSFKINSYNIDSLPIKKEKEIILHGLALLLFFYIIKVIIYSD